MADPLRSADSSSRYPGAPRWVKVLGTILIALILLVVMLQLTGVGGRHGPGRHMPTGDSAGQAAPPATTEEHTSPESSY